MEKLIEDLNDILEVLNETKEKSESVFAWYVFNDHTLKVELKIHSIDDSVEEIILKPDPKSVFLVRELVSGLGTINIYVPKKLLIFSAEFKNVDDEGGLKLATQRFLRFMTEEVGIEFSLKLIFWLPSNSRENWNKKSF